MKNILFVIFIISLLSSCKKEAGEGGLASIKGKVQTDLRLVPSNPVTFQYSRPGVDEEVYIIYGDNTGPDDRVWTNYKGEFEFRNLRPGDYKIYVYSRDTTGSAQVNMQRMPIVREVKIEDRKGEVDAGTITIYDVP
ncbi:MAG: hypothetical protein ACOVQ5_04650 [Flavobacteriales bacterium]|jgi:hypothetical protein